MKKKIYLFLLLTFILYVSFKTVKWKIKQLEDTKISIKKETIFVIKSGTGRFALVNQLCDEKVINLPYAFQLLLCLSPQLSHFQSGTYQFIPKMSMHEVFQLLRNGKEAQFSLRLIEGMRLSDFLKRLRDAPYIRHTLKDDTYETVAKALDFEHIEQMEGWFFPDTLLYNANTTDVAILKRAHNKMVNVVEEIWKNKEEGLFYKNQNQFVTMASIVEKETATMRERRKVASVLTNRLRIGMRLQSDSTVIYGIGMNHRNQLSREILKIPTAYNTYIINGLPPGPISAPSKSSLNAAAHPDKTQYLYFVSNGMGGLVFNTNLSAHNRSVRDYLRLLRKKNAQQLHCH